MLHDGQSRARVSPAVPARCKCGPSGQRRAGEQGELSATNIARLTAVWGARADGQNELIAVEDGYRESAESWKSVLRDLKRRGMQAPVLAVGDGALGFWKVCGRCGLRRASSAIGAARSPMSLISCPRAWEAVRSGHYMRSCMRRRALRPSKASRSSCRRSRPNIRRSTASSRTAKRCSPFFDFPAEHWEHLRTSNPIESSFTTVRLRQRMTKGAGSRAKALTMAFQLLMLA